MDATVPYSLSDIKLPDSPSNLVKTSGKTNYKKESSSPKKVQQSDEESHSDTEVQANGVGSISKPNDTHSNGKSVSKSKPLSAESSTKDVTPDSQSLIAKEIKGESQNDISSDTVNSKNKYESRSPSKKKSLSERNVSDSEDKSSSKVDTSKDSNSSSSKSEESSSEESSSEEENRKRRSRITSMKLSKKKKPRTPSSSRSPSSHSRESSPAKEMCDESSNLKNKSVSDIPKVTVASESEKSPIKTSAVDSNKPIISEPSRKKLKINRNNVVLPAEKAEGTSPEKTKSSRISLTKSDPRSPDKTKSSRISMTKSDQRSPEKSKYSRISMSKSDERSPEKTKYSKISMAKSDERSPEKIKSSKISMTKSKERSPEKTKFSRISMTKSDQSSEKTIESAKISSSPKKLSPIKIPEDKSREPSSPLHLSSEANEPEMGEIIENSPEMKYEPRKLKFPGRKLNRKSSEDQSSTEPKAKKSKWGKFASSQKSSQAINISTDSLKNWFPEFKLVNETNKTESMNESSPTIIEDKKLSFTISTADESDKKSSTPNVVPENNKEQSLEINESSGPVSKIVFIQNLVRPFTLLQLKELLKQTGNLNEEEFWIDKIKSKCFATYESDEEAIKTRNALNGTRWPSSNPKILVAEFSTEEELELHRSGADVLKPIPESLSHVKESLDTKSSHLLGDHRKRERDSEKRKERDRYRQQLPVREWDKDKISQESPDRENIGKESDGLRTLDKRDKKDSKKRLNEDTPAKLLDDLFQKTKSAPCIYWLPLTDVQLVEREEARKLRRLEREKRIQQREQDDSEHKNKRPRVDNKSKDSENRRSSSRSPANRRR